MAKRNSRSRSNGQANGRTDIRRVAGIAMYSHPLDIPRNVEIVKEHMARGAEAGAQLVLLPELCISGMAPDAYTVAFTADDDVLHDLAETAKKLKIAASVGFFEKDGRKRYVSQAFLHKGKIASVCRKIFCCETGGSDGEEFHVVKWDGAIVGTCICWDMHFPLVARELAKRGAVLILHPSSYSGSPGAGRAARGANSDHFQTRTRAVDCGAFFFHQNASGETVKKGRICGGNGYIVSPSGGIISQVDFNPWTESIIVADIDLEAAKTSIHRDWLMQEKSRTGLIEHLPGRKNPNPIKAVRK